MKKYFKYFKAFCAFCAFWLLLSGILNKEMLFMMSLSSILTLVILHKMDLVPEIRFTLPGFIYSWRMIENMIITSIATLKYTHAEKPKFVSEIIDIEFEHGLKNQMDTVLQAAAITMTPGTAVIAVDTKNSRMLVHGLDESMLKTLPDDSISRILLHNKRVKRKK